MLQSLEFFFFSSRRRHTIYIGDWSSDVCSSDLAGSCRGSRCFNAREARSCACRIRASAPVMISEIGRASCRESVEIMLRRVRLEESSEDKVRCEVQAQPSEL